MPAATVRRPARVRPQQPLSDEVHVHDLSDRVVILETTVERIDSNVASINDTLAHTATKEDLIGMRQDLRLLTSQLQSSGRPQWTVIFAGLAVVFTVLTAIGGLAYLPIQQGQAVLSEGIAALAAQQVPRDEYEARRENADRRLAELQAEIDEVGDRQYDSLLRELERARSAP